MCTNDTQLLSTILLRLGFSPCDTLTTDQILNRLTSILLDAQRFEALCTQFPSPAPPNQQTIQEWLNQITTLRTIADLCQHILHLDSRS